MTDKLPFFAPGHHTTILQRTPKPGEEVWRLRNDQGRIVTCELRDDSRAGLGWDVQLLEDGELLWSKRCPTEVFVRWAANCFRQDYTRTGFTESQPHRNSDGSSYGAVSLASAMLGRRFIR